jgi:formate hydrogenlyase subunit 6/NADH:ubiquinone oxidoreductase subunit I
MARLYPGDTRYILDAFCIDEGEGESFELNAHPPLREAFSIGGATIPERGFVITRDCTQCGTCAEICPEKCVSAGSTDAEPYRINQSHCIRCGLCFERCPAEAVKDRG